MLGSKKIIQRSKAATHVPDDKNLLVPIQVKCIYFLCICSCQIFNSGFGFAILNESVLNNLLCFRNRKSKAKKTHTHTHTHKNPNPHIVYWTTLHTQYFWEIMLLPTTVFWKYSSKNIFFYAARLLFKNNIQTIKILSQLSDFKR